MMDIDEVCKRGVHRVTENEVGLVQPNVRFGLAHRDRHGKNGERKKTRLKIIRENIRI